MDPLVCASATAVHPCPGNSNRSWASWHCALASGASRGVIPTCTRLILLPLGWLYGLTACIRNALYNSGYLKSLKVPVPVISIGNITAGGTGKTPMVEWVASLLRDNDFRPAILSRGYKGAGGANDEALLLEEHLADVPHLQGADRHALALAAIEELEAEILVLDDGFQHRKLGHDLDMVLLDATNPWGYGHMLPRGTLREPKSGLRRADVIVVTRADQAAEATLKSLAKEIESIAPGKLLCEAIHQPVECIRYSGAPLPLEALKGKRVLVFCGLGNPAALLATLKSLGAQIAETLLFPDHHPYGAQDVEKIIAWADKSSQGGDLLVTSEKDLVKLRSPSLGDHPLYALSVRMEIRKGQEPLKELILATIRKNLQKVSSMEGETNA